jgi:four helix bundle protein
MNASFDHEKLNVYRQAISFNGWVGALLERVQSRAAVKDQLDRAATSIPLNIAEGNGKFSRRDRGRYFDIARGSSLESAACLDVLRSRCLIDEETLASGKEQLVEIMNMLVGLLRRFGYDFEQDRGSSVVREMLESGALEQVHEQDEEKEAPQR